MEETSRRAASAELMAQAHHGAAAYEALAENSDLHTLESPHNCLRPNSPQQQQLSSRITFHRFFEWANWPRETIQ